MQGSADGSTRKEDSHRLIYKDLGIQPGTGPLLPGVREPLVEPFLIITYLACRAQVTGLFPHYSSVSRVGTYFECAG